jgi:hypothetical protein
MTEYLDPKQAVEEIDRLAKKPRRTEHRDEGTWQVAPTPTSLRREAREKAQRRVQDQATPAPALARRREPRP